MLDITMLYVLVVLLSVLATPLANPVPAPEAKGRFWVVVTVGMVFPAQVDR